MPIVLFIANLFGISVVRLAIYAAVAVSVVVGAVAIRQHYINKGYAAAIAAVKRQDNIAIDAAKKVEKKAAVCSDANGYWDVITQSCKLGDE